ncbi:MAG TPA: hypothetical protein VG456_26600 [Candidatus Sulfopaludibacter sp.]|jgi:hypothetical protein|nr:hypothetical protein [Candidatus Sulfopaludibacter sp.]
MRTLIRLAATVQLLLIFPAALFLTAVLLDGGDAPRYDLARFAHRIVMWYSARMWALWLLLLALPLAVLLTGAATLLRSWNRDFEQPHAARPSLAMIPAPLATLLVAGTTLTSAGVLAVVVLHMLAD